MGWVNALKSKFNLHMKSLGLSVGTGKLCIFGHLGISLYLEFFCFLSFITFVIRNLCSGTHRRSQKFVFNACM